MARSACLVKAFWPGTIIVFEALCYTLAIEKYQIYKLIAHRRVLRHKLFSHLRSVVIDVIVMLSVIQ